ncbi:MAG: hypothetical protein ACTSPI_16950, partial [Candidatus Heimdallarchaeaceae archaeon]
MKWTERGKTLEVSYLSKRMWYLILLLIVVEILLLLIITGLLVYMFWWMQSNDVLVHLFDILESCGKC